jgi:two-component system CheB/CheR fusion protein
MDNLLASTEIGTIFLDRDLRIRKFTPQVGRSFNLLPQDLGRRIDNFTHTLDYPDLLEDVRRILESGTPVEREIRDLHGRWLLLRILPYRSQSRIDGAVLTLVDISGLKQARAELHESQELLQQVLDNSSTLIYVKDLDGRYLLVNRNCEPILCVPPEQVRGKTDHDFLPAEVADVLREHDRRVLESGETMRFEETLPCGEERRTWLSVKFPLRDRGERICAVGGVCTDITDQKRAEVESRHAVELRDRFLAMLSHELRNPLNAIVNAVEVMNAPAETLEALEGRTEARRIIARQARQMSRLLDDLLDVSRVTQNKIELRSRVLDLCQVIEEVEQVLRPTMGGRRLSFSCEVQDAPLAVEGDPARLQQTFVNLLNNAVKYTPEGGDIRVAARREGDEAVVTVRDSGVGIPADMLPHVFELFVQSDDSLDRSDGGLGVGLSLVQSIVEMHGGTVTAHSDGPGRGSEFVVRLPLAAADARPRDVPPSDSRPRNGDAEAAAKYRILVVEDNADSRSMLQMLLRLQGHEVSTAPDGVAGLEALLEQSPDLAFVDIGLPGLDGYQLARSARERGLSGTLLVALTGFGQPADQRRALDAGFDLHVVKPFKMDDLDHIFAEAAQRKGT